MYVCVCVCMSVCFQPYDCVGVSESGVLKNTNLMAISIGNK